LYDEAFALSVTIAKNNIIFIPLLFWQMVAPSHTTVGLR